MEALREKLYRYIEKYGFTDPRTVEVSQALDVFVAEAQKGELLCQPNSSVNI